MQFGQIMQSYVIPKTHPLIGDDTRVRLKHLPPIDGIRAVAILSVILFHTRVPGFEAGTLGVDIFFVLSGFLITSLLLDERQTRGRISFKRFYLRRALRLLPAFFVMIACCSALSAWLLPEKQHRYNTWAAMLSVLYVMNWRELFGLFKPTWFAHCWSLSLEEQFYLLWPLVLTLLCARTQLNKLGGVFLRLTLLFMALRCAIVVANLVPYVYVYHGLHTRADSLLAGCTVVAFYTERTRAALAPHRRALAFGTSVLVLTAFYMCSFRTESALEEYLELFGFTHVAAAAAVGFLYVVTFPDSLLSRILSHRFLVLTGKISYGLYLWHYPLTKMMRGHASWEVVTLIVVALSYACATASYRFVELPFLRLKERWGRHDAGPVTLLAEEHESSASQMEPAGLADHDRVCDEHASSHRVPDCQ